MNVTLAVLALIQVLVGTRLMGANMQRYHNLTAGEQQIIEHKGTEPPFSGELTDLSANGVYVCKRCDAPLFLAEHKFSSHCGWPSFEDELPGAVQRQTDADGRRTEILCRRCGGHLGHVFSGEQLTAKNLRHCVNSISMRFLPAVQDGLERAIFAGGCFWGVQYLLQNMSGVVTSRVGYTGGTVANPNYAEVCSGKTGHAEAVEVRFDPRQTSYGAVAKRFFEIHDPTQHNRQGPDKGHQYRSAVFYLSAPQQRTAEALLAELKANGYKVVTEVIPASVFYAAEDYHQDYYQTKNATPYCHSPVPRFEAKNKLLSSSGL